MAESTEGPKVRIVGNEVDGYDIWPNWQAGLMPIVRLIPGTLGNQGEFGTLEAAQDAAGHRLTARKDYLRLREKARETTVDITLG